MADKKTSSQLPFDLGHNHSYGRGDFFTSNSNAAALGWIDKWPDWPAPFLLIYGPAGCGKTHLLNIWQQETRAKKNIKTASVDDIDLKIGDREEEERLFHLYNDMKETGGYILAASQTPVQEWPFTVPDLKSRLMAAPAVAIGSPDDQLLDVVLTKLFSDRQLIVSPEVIQFILGRSERSFAALHRAVDMIDRKALAERRAVTIPFIRDMF